MDTGIDIRKGGNQNVQHFRGNKPVLTPMDNTEDHQDHLNDSLQEKIDENYGEKNYNLYSGDAKQYSSLDKDRPFSSARKRNSGKKQYNVTFKTNPSPNRFEGDEETAYDKIAAIQKQLEEDERIVSEFEQQAFASKDSNPHSRNHSKGRNLNIDQALNGNEAFNQNQRPPKRGVKRFNGRSRSPNQAQFADNSMVDKDLRMKPRVLKPVVHNNRVGDLDSPKPRNIASPTPVSRNPGYENPTMYDKLAKKIRQQAKRIIELESELSDTQKNTSKHASILARNSSNNFKEEMLVIRKKNDLLNQENEVLREKIDILSRSLEQKKEQIVAQSFAANTDGDKHFENMSARDFNERAQMINKVSDLETEKIELEEVLKKEVIKNEKLESMVDLLKKINEEKLEQAGFIPYHGKTRVETVIDAAHVFDNNQTLQDQNSAKNHEIQVQIDEIEALKELITNLNKKNDQLVNFKVLTDQKLLQQRRQELKYSKALEQLKDQAQMINVQLNTEKRRKQNLTSQLSSCREAMGMFLNSADDVSEVMNYLANDLLL